MAVISFASARGSWDLLPGPCNVRSYQATMGRAAGRPERQAVPFGSVSGARNLGRAALAEPAKSPPPRGPQGKNARPPRRLNNHNLDRGSWRDATSRPSTDVGHRPWSALRRDARVGLQVRDRHTLRGYRSEERRVGKEGRSRW